VEDIFNLEKWAAVSARVPVLFSPGLSRLCFPPPTQPSPIQTERQKVDPSQHAPSFSPRPLHFVPPPTPVPQPPTATKKYTQANVIQFVSHARFCLQFSSKITPLWDVTACSSAPSCLSVFFVKALTYQSAWAAVAQSV
jgi:hypothetical protein